MSTDQDPLHRPFLDAMRGAGPAAPVGSESGDTGDETVRPYFVTGGRVHDEVVGFETVYSLTAGGEIKRTGLSFEKRAIADLCQSPQSVAEISALLHMPLGVASVLALDLVSDGLLDSSVSVDDPTGNPELIMRLIHAVHAL